MVQILGKEVGSTGFGLMGLTWRKELVTEEQAITTMKAAFDNGMRLWSGAEGYEAPAKPGYNSMSIVKAYFTKYPEDADKVVLCIKGGSLVEISGSGSAEKTRSSIQNILQQLGGTKKLDIWCPIRRDADTPLSETLKAAQEFVDDGRVGGLGLSEVSAKSLLEGAQVTQLALCELELSMFSPDILRNGVAAACAEYNIPVLAYSPNGRGLLTGRFTESSPPTDLIAEMFPRLHGEGFKKNLALVEQTKALAQKKGCTPAQFALAWVRAQGEHGGNPPMLPIPGSTRVPRVEENAKVITLTEEELKEVNAIVDNFETVGARYADPSLAST